MNKQELKIKWDKENESYKKREVGSGVQKFVKDVLKSPDYFNFEEGLNSTPLENKRKEFIEESKTKANRSADIVIYIDSDIIIPVEVEKYSNIDQGLGQLFQYQLDLNKKYGILTDGYTWRFYNNAYLVKEITIEQFFKNAELFKEFWSEYIKPEDYYLSFFEERGQLKIIPEDLSVEKRRQDFFKDITTLIRGFKNKLDIEGYFGNLEKKEKEKKAVEITYAYIIQFILYKTLVDNEFDDFRDKFDKTGESIYECLKVSQFGKILGIINGISNEISKDIYRPFAKEQEFINETLIELFRKPKNDLHEVSPWLDIFVFIKKYNFANVRNEIFGYIYENYLKELYEDTKKGQYFTDPAVVNFMLEQVGYTKEEIRKRVENEPDDNYLSLIDPSCGSGTFLYSATDRLIEAIPNGSEETSQKIEGLINENIFGLDIEEFPLYLAEMNIVMRMLPLIMNERYNNPIDKKIKVFKTRDSISEFMDTALRNTISDINLEYQKNGGQGTLFTTKLNLGYSSYVRDEDDLNEMKKSLENYPKITRYRFDYVIGNPPYVSFKECSKQKVLFFELMKQRKIKLSNIYGVNLHSTPDNQKRYAPNPNLYTFFIALGLGLLKDKGKLCYIIPQTILTAGDLDVIRYHLAKYITLEKIIIFSGKMFLGRGLKQDRPVATSSLILVASKMLPSISHEVEVINCENKGDDINQIFEDILNKKRIVVKKIQQNKLLKNILNWNFIKQSRDFINFYEHYKKETDDISNYYNHSTAKSLFGYEFYFDRGIKYPKNKIENLTKDSKNYYRITKSNKKGYKVLSDNKIIAKNLLDFPFGSQGDIVFQKKYKIVWSYINYDRFRMADEDIMIDYNSVLISSDDRSEILYLLSILNSKVSINILEKLLRNENEKDILIGIKTIKEFIRIPRINEDNEHLKEEIIIKTEEMLRIEDLRISDLVDFSNVLVQKFNGFEIEGNNLFLIKGKDKFKCKIKNNQNIVNETLKINLSENRLFKKDKIGLAELKSLPAIDFERQKQLKDYIDDLIFALYFNIPIEKVELSKAEELKKECGESIYYKIVQNNQ
jgi:hypothetical protein